MSNEPLNNLNVNTNFFGVQSCASCRYVNYNGQICGLSVSPRYGQKITSQDWCRFWGPKMQNPSLDN